METKWTKGVWTIDEWYSPQFQGEIYNIAPEGRHDDFRIATVYPECGGDGEEVLANAHVMKAGPLLYEALDSIIGEAAFDGLPESKKAAIEAALAAARGEAGEVGDE